METSLHTQPRQKEAPLSLAGALELFALDNQARRLTPSSQAAYRNSLRIFMAWCEAEQVTLVHQVDALCVRRYQVALQARRGPRGAPLSSSYVHGLLRAVRRFLAFCVAEGVVAETPIRTVRRVIRSS